METQRQWYDLAIARATPALLGLFSWTALEPIRCKNITPSPSAPPPGTTSHRRPSSTPSPWCDATFGWRRRISHCRPAAPTHRNSPSLCITEWWTPSLTPLEMRKAQTRGSEFHPPYVVARKEPLQIVVDGRPANPPPPDWRRWRTACRSSDRTIIMRAERPVAGPGRRFSMCRLLDVIPVLSHSCTVPKIPSPADAFRSTSGYHCVAIPRYGRRCALGMETRFWESFHKSPTLRGRLGA